MTRPSGYLYAVIFKQGTVKVGMSTINPRARMDDHFRAGARFGIEVAHEITAPVGTDDLALREVVLCNYCAAEFRPESGAEWFRCKEGPEHALSRITEFLGKIGRDDFSDTSRRNRYLPTDYEARLVFAMSLIRNGVTVPTAATMMGIEARNITGRKVFKDWRLEQTKKTALEQQPKETT